jgi:hypothetical protein
VDSGESGEEEEGECSIRIQPYFVDVLWRRT